MLINQSKKCLNTQSQLSKKIEKYMYHSVNIIVELITIEILNLNLIIVHCIEKRKTILS